MLRCLKGIAGPHKMYHRMSRGTTTDQVRGVKIGEEATSMGKWKGVTVLGMGRRS